MSIPATKGQIKITPGALVCNEAEIIGDVSIGVRTVVHPKARIIAEGGLLLVCFFVCICNFPMTCQLTQWNEKVVRPYS